MNLTNHELMQAAWTQLWQVTVLIGLVALVVRVCCRQRPHLAHVLWMLVIVKCLTPPLWSSPAGIFSWAQLERAQPVSPATEPDLESELLPPLSVEGPARAAVAETPLAPPVTRARISPVWFLGLTWLGGAVALGAFMLIRSFGYYRIVQTRGEADPQVEAIARDVARRLCVRQKFRVAVLSDEIGPAVFGIVRPTLLIHQALVAGRRPEEIEPILAHELVHIRRGDAFFGLLQLFAQVVWWFHPLLWWANREICRLRERCCDEEAVAGIACPPARYVRCLIDVLELNLPNRPVMTFPAAHGARITSQRLEHIMERSTTFRRRTPRVYWLVLLAAGVLVLPGAALTLRGSTPGEEDDDAPATKSLSPDRPTHLVAVTLSDAEREAEEALKEFDAEKKIYRNDDGEVLGIWVEVDTSQFTDKDLAHLRALTWCQNPTAEQPPNRGGMTYYFPALELANTRVSDAGLQQIRGLAPFTYLAVTGSHEVTDKSLEIIGSFAALKRLMIHGTSVTDEGLVHLKSLGDLEWLGLGETKVTDAGLVHIRDIDALEWLDLSGTDVTNAGLANLKGLTGLKKLDLNNTAIDDAGLAHLAGLTELEDLAVKGTGVTDAGLVHLKDLDLQLLRLSGARKITDDGVEYLKRFGNLRGLWLSGTEVTDEGMKHLTAFPNLELLIIREVDITDAGLENLKTLTKLKNVWLNGTKITDRGLAHLKDLSDLNVLYLNGTDITDAGLAHLTGLNNLRRLFLNGTSVSEEAVAKLRTALPDCTIGFP